MVTPFENRLGRRRESIIGQLRARDDPPLRRIAIILEEEVVAFAPREEKGIGVEVSRRRKDHSIPAGLGEWWS
jgi:hypothetical protein